MKLWLAISLSAVVSLGVVIPPVALARTTTPEPEVADYDGPCFLELVCNNGSVLRCNGSWECNYQSDSPGSPGWIRCDGAGQGCGGIDW